jgi:hypothetical protein
VEVFQTIPSVTSSSAGASLPVDARDGHVYSEQRRLAYRLFQLRAELAAFEDQYAAWLESPQGRFELWYAERERRRKRA